MKKLAVFTEGQTEQLLIESIVKYIANNKAISIVKKEATGGKMGSRNFEIIEAYTAHEERAEATFYIMLMNCGTDTKVVSDVIENHSNLLASGYQKIIAIRDVYPDYLYEEITKFREGVNKIIRSKIKEHSLVSLMLAVMEIEAWFLAEHNHFPKIHEKITLDRIKSEIGIDPQNDDLSKRMQALLKNEWVATLN